MKPIVTKQKAFGGNWFMFYCGKCNVTIDTNHNPRDTHCEKCGEIIDWETNDSI
jgi:hypothetical protein